jgi:hypothetical protein
VLIVTPNPNVGVPVESKLPSRVVAVTTPDTLTLVGLRLVTPNVTVLVIPPTFTPEGKSGAPSLLSLILLTLICDIV